MTKISEQDVLQLHQLLRKKGVFYSDYRVELIDHLICCVQDNEGDMVDNVKHYLTNNPEFVKPYKLSFFGLLIAQPKSRTYSRKELFSLQNSLTVLLLVIFFFVIQVLLIHFINYFEVVQVVSGLNNLFFVLFVLYLIVDCFTNKNVFSLPVIVFVKSLFFANIVLWGSIIYALKVESSFGLLLGAVYSTYIVSSILLYFQLRKKEMLLFIN